MSGILIVSYFDQIYGLNYFSRYHLDDEQRFAHFQPGRISHTLRKALGLSRRQLPRHIYNMRRLGYPPGWMQEAKISHSGISLFDSLGQGI